MPRKKPNKFLKIKDKVVALPKKALGYGHNNPLSPNGKSLDQSSFEARAKADEIAKQFLEAKEQGLITGKETNIPRHIRELLQD